MPSPSCGAVVKNTKTTTPVVVSPYFQPAQQPNVLMCRTVARLLLHARHFGWMRSAGIRTFSAVEECVADSKYVAMCTPVDEPLQGCHAPIQPSNLKGRYDEDGDDSTAAAYESGDDDEETPVVSDAEEDDEAVVVEDVAEDDDATVSDESTTTTLIVSHAAMRRGIVSGNPTRTIQKFNPTHIKYHWDCKKKVVSRKFLSGCPRLESVELLGFENVVAVGDDFMSNCPKVSHFDFATSMPKLKQVGRSFLGGCTGLLEVDMAPLLLSAAAASSSLSHHQSEYDVNIITDRIATISTTTTTTTTTVDKDSDHHHEGEEQDHLDSDVDEVVRDGGGNKGKMSHTNTTTTTNTVFLTGVLFLTKCPLIKTINLQPFTNTSTIREGFMSYCTGLEEIDLTPFSSVVWILEDFLKGCSGLKKIDLTPFSQVTHITGGFMSECSGIASIDMSPLVKLKNAGGYFMERCTCLKCVTFGSHPDMQCIDAEFLKMCTSLKSVEISRLVNLRRIYKDFLAGCSSVEYVDLLATTKTTTPSSLLRAPALHPQKAPIPREQNEGEDNRLPLLQLPRVQQQKPQQRRLSADAAPFVPSVGGAVAGDLKMNIDAGTQKQPMLTITPPPTPTTTQRMVAVSARGFLQGCTQLRDPDVSGIRFTEQRTRRRIK